MIGPGVRVQSLFHSFQCLVLSENLHFCTLAMDNALIFRVRTLKSTKLVSLAWGA